METGTKIKVNLFEIERYALNDGPGIRTALFFKGCPLFCLWCSNPESQKSEPELFYRRDKCLGCRNCVEACEHSALSFAEHLIIDRSECTGCGDCAEACRTGELSLLGKDWEVDEVVEIIRKDESFYKKSGGGVTFSGGEPTMQQEALLEIAKRCRFYSYHTSIETCGYFDWGEMEKVLPYLDLFLFDIKHMDSEKHRELTGVSNTKILNNYQKMIDADKEIVVRFPLIPGINDDDIHLEKLIRFLKNASPGIRIDILPYHRLGNSKYSCLEKEYTLRDIEPQTEEKSVEIANLLARNGFEVRIEK